VFHIVLADTSETPHQHFNLPLNNDGQTSTHAKHKLGHTAKKNFCHKCATLDTVISHQFCAGHSICYMKSFAVVTISIADTCLQHSDWVLLTHLVVIEQHKKETSKPDNTKSRVSQKKAACISELHVLPSLWYLNSKNHTSISNTLKTSK
jgi:hypothetical protein